MWGGSSVQIVDLVKMELEANMLTEKNPNGSDHVDAHRLTAYVAGGYVISGYVDYTMYATSGMLRTMELIFGMPPMSQYDAAATPMW